MNNITKAMSVAVLVTLGLALMARAAAAENVWTLKTDDTHTVLAVRENKLFIEELKNPAQGWNWTPKPSEVPLLAQVVVGGAPCPLTWSFREATTATDTNGTTLTLQFTSTTPNLELKSFWRTLPGPGPVENWMTVENKSGKDVTYMGSDTPAANMRLRSDVPVTLYRFTKTAVGPSHVSQNSLQANAKVSTGSEYIPFQILDAGSKHGFYIGNEWELGNFFVSSGDDRLDLKIAVHPLGGQNVTQGSGDILTIPSAYYGTYQGDIDDGGNRFKRWFWNHKIPASLRDHPDEPWTVLCFSALDKSPGFNWGTTPQTVYDQYAATGVECIKIDAGWDDKRNWTYRPAQWPDGFDYATKARKAGLKVCLYMQGTYKDCDLNTVAGRDLQISALSSNYEAGWYDMWKSDLYGAPTEPFPQTYEGTKTFLHILDVMIKKYPGFRYENCCNGGKYKGFSILRRTTFVVTNDEVSSDACRATLYVNSYAINPAQLINEMSRPRGGGNDHYYFRSCMMGAVLTDYGFGVPLYSEYISLYKTKVRPILRGADVYHILPQCDGKNWDGMQFFNPNLNKGAVFLFKPSASAVDGDSKVVKLKGLEKNVSYTLTFQDRTSLNTAMTGEQLMRDGIPVRDMTGSFASEIIWIDGPSKTAK
jgi:hypothetical protein